MDKNNESVEELEKGSLKRKSRKKLWISLVVVGLVLVGAGSAFWVWHEQPSFCNAICHSPMDPYVEGYYSDDPSLLVVSHAQAGTTCLECHDPTISEQVSEVVMWLSNDYSDPIPVKRFGTVDYCGQCHDDDNASTGLDWDHIVTVTESYQESGRNPHDSHLGNIECYTCHSMHGESKNYCAQCHDNIKSPDSW